MGQNKFFKSIIIVIFFSIASVVYSAHAYAWGEDNSRGHRGSYDMHQQRDARETPRHAAREVREMPRHENRDGYYRHDRDGHQDYMIVNTLIGAVVQALTPSYRRIIIINGMPYYTYDNGGYYTYAVQQPVGYVVLPN